MGLCNTDCVRVFKVNENYRSWIELTREANEFVDDIQTSMTDATQNANVAKDAALAAKSAAYAGAMAVGDKIRWVKLHDMDDSVSFTGRFVTVDEYPAIDISSSVGEEEATALRIAFGTTKYLHNRH